MLEILDVLRNSLTHEIHKELGNFHEHYVLVFTNPLDYTLGKNYIDSEPNSGLSNSEKLELNYFQGDIPADLITLPCVKIIWALQTTQNGTFPEGWGECSSLEILNLCQNLLTSRILIVLGRCRNLYFLAWEAINLEGWFLNFQFLLCFYLMLVEKNYLATFQLARIIASPNHHCFQ